MRALGILILIAGIAALVFSNYITDQVLEGKTKIASGEKSVSQGKQFFNSNPYTQGLGEAMSGSAEKKIAKGKEEVARYEILAQQLHTGGVIALFVGAGICIFAFFGKKKKR